MSNKESTGNGAKPVIRQDKLASFLLENKALLLAIVAFIVCGIISPQYFLTPQNFRNVLRQVSASCVLGAGFTAIMSSGGIDLSVGYLVGLLGVIAGILDVNAGLPFWCVVIITLAIGAAAGVINIFTGVITKVPMFITTLATGQIFRGICFVISHNTPIINVSDGMRFMGQGFIWIIPFPVVIMVITLVVLWFFLTKTVYGRWAVAIGGNAETARLSGINVNRIWAIVYAIVGMCCALTALILNGRAVSAQPSAGSGMEMDAITAVVVGGTSMQGGRAKVFGTFCGVLLVGFLTNILNLVGLDTNYQYILKGAMTITAVTLDTVAQGFFQRQLKKAVQ